jgi:hypothetical protein
MIHQQRLYAMGVGGAVSIVVLVFGTYACVRLLTMPVVMQKLLLIVNFEAVLPVVGKCSGFNNHRARCDDPSALQHAPWYLRTFSRQGTTRTDWSGSVSQRAISHRSL